MTRPGGPADSGGRSWGRARRSPSRIGLWGAATTGKSTMLAALQRAADERPDGPDNWMVFGGTPEGSAFLRTAGNALSRGEFPEANFSGANDLTISLMRGARASSLARLLRPSARRRRFDVRVLDVRGEWYGPDPDQASLRRADQGYSDSGQSLFTSGDPIDDLVEHLARADGIVYLFDPTQEESEGSAYLHLRGMLERVVSRAAELDRLVDGWLPHYLAVCVHKLDDPYVFRKAGLGGFLSMGHDPAHAPRVADEDALAFFEKLCSESVTHGGPVLGAIRRHFRPDRVRYFVSSSVGFYVGPGGFFHRRDFANVDPTTHTIRGRIRPINVLEPFLWLVESTRRDQPPRPIDERGRRDAPAAERRPKTRDEREAPDEQRATERPARRRRVRRRRNAPVVDSASPAAADREPSGEPWPADDE